MKFAIIDIHVLLPVGDIISWLTGRALILI